MDNEEDLKTAFRTLASKNRLAKHYIKKKLAQDAGEHWITIHGENGNGSHVMLDSEGRIMAGMGGHFKGVKIDDIPRKSFINEKAYQRRQRANKPKIDFSHSGTISKNLIIQNRNRGTQASQAQIREIGANPDYLRLSDYRTLQNGTPIISYGSYKDEQLGRKVKSADNEGKRYDVQLAVVEANDVLASHDANGNENKEFYQDNADKPRAIAGNGRIAGLQLGYNNGKAENYKQELIDDADMHGIDPEVIKKMKNPILVRIMQPKDITSDIGDKTNTISNLSMNAVEQANNDKQRVNFSDIKADYDGTPDNDSLLAFIYKMPKSEQGQLLDSKGRPTRQAQERLKAAMFAKAYNNDKLTDSYSQALKADSRNIINGLAIASNAVNQLEGLSPEYDIRDIIADAATRAVEAREGGQSLQELAKQKDMFADEDADNASRAILQMFADNSRSANNIGQKIKKLAETLKAEQEASTGDLFGGFGAPSKAELIHKALAQDSTLYAKIRTFWRNEGNKCLCAIWNGNKHARKAFFNELKHFIG